MLHEPAVRATRSPCTSPSARRTWTTLLPMDSNIDDNIWVLDIVYDGLMRYDPETTEPYPYVAESIDTTDNQVWTITIKPDLTFQNGEPVDAGRLRPGVELRRLRAQRHGQQLLLRAHPGLRRDAGRDRRRRQRHRRAGRRHAVGTEGRRRPHARGHAQRTVRRLLDDARLHRVLPGRPGVHRRHRRLRVEADRQRPVPDRRVAAGGEPHRQQVGRLHPRRDAELRRHRVDRVRRGVELARLPGRRPRHQLPAARRAGRRRRRRRPAVALRRTARCRPHLPRLPAVPRGSLAGRRSSARRSRWRSTARASSTP